MSLSAGENKALGPHATKAAPGHCQVAGCVAPIFGTVTVSLSGPPIPPGAAKVDVCRRHIELITAPEAASMAWRIATEP